MNVSSILAVDAAMAPAPLRWWSGELDGPANCREAAAEEDIGRTPVFIRTDAAEDLAELVYLSGSVRDTDTGTDSVDPRTSVSSPTTPPTLRFPSGNRPPKPPADVGSISPDGDTLYGGGSGIRE